MENFVKENKQTNEFKVLVIGLDGATFDLVRPWAIEGKLPNLAKIMKNGVSANLKSTIPAITPTAWASFITGKNPGGHSVFAFEKRQPNSYDGKIVNASDIDGDALWTILGKMGKKVVVINVPMTYPLDKVNGIMISGYLTPPNTDITYPPDLKKKLDEETGGYEIYMTANYGESEKAIEAWIRNLYLVTRKRAKATLYLLENYEWDFFMVVFSGTDWISHALWKYMDPKCLGFQTSDDLKKVKKYGNAIQRYYQEMDYIIGKIIKRIDEDVTLILMSDHGQGPLCKTFEINNWLRSSGLLKFKKKSIRYFGWIEDLLERVLDFLLTHPKTMVIARRIWNAFRMQFSILKDVDWSHTKAYTFGDGIFINLKGRDPEGIVEPEEYEKLRNHIIQSLYALNDPETKERIVEKIFRKEEIYSGPNVDKAPDLLFQVKSPYIVYRGLEVGSQIIRPAVNFPLGYKREGLSMSSRHEMNGIFIATGRNIIKNKIINDASIMDLAPTILHMMNVDVPLDMDGRVLKEIFVRGGRVRTRVPTFKLKEKKKYITSKEQEQEIRKRLKALGYLE